MKFFPVHWIRGKKGNVTTLWVAGLPAFILLLLGVSTIANAWMTHAVSQKAGDAASLAVTKELDKRYRSVLNEKIQEIMQQNENMGVQPGDPGYQDPSESILGTDELKRRLLVFMMDRHRDDLKSVARAYAKKNGGGEHGKIILSRDGRVEVESHTPFQPSIFEEEFDEVTITGSGRGPTRAYLKPLSKDPMVIDY